jgi:hypothetical protein
MFFLFTSFELTFALFLVLQKSLYDSYTAARPIRTRKPNKRTNYSAGGELERIAYAVLGSTLKQEATQKEKGNNEDNKCEEGDDDCKM